MLSARNCLSYFAVACAAILLAGCGTSRGLASADRPAPVYASWNERLPCVDRIGRCFDAVFDNQLATVIAEKSRYQTLKTKLEKENEVKREVYWELKEPVDGRRVFEIVTKPTAMGLAHVGEPKSGPDLNIFALDDQDIDSKEELVANQSVRVNGQAVVTKQDTITQDFLPPGRYVIGVRYSGAKNWDRKYVYLVVK
jgi:hypothetical protein